MEKYNAKNLDDGLYKIFWTSGGCSLAAVGRTHDGGVWYKPCNWIDLGVCIDWWQVADVELIMSTKELNSEETKSPLSEKQADMLQSRTESIADITKRLETVEGMFTATAKDRDGDKTRRFIVVDARGCTHLAELKIYELTNENERLYWLKYGTHDEQILKAQCVEVK